MSKIKTFFKSKSFQSSNECRQIPEILVGHAFPVQCIKGWTATWLVAASQLAGQLCTNGRRIGQCGMAETVQEDHFLAVWTDRAGLQVARAELGRLASGEWERWILGIFDYNCGNEVLIRHFWYHSIGLEMLYRMI